MRRYMPQNSNHIQVLYDGIDAVSHKQNVGSRHAFSTFQKLINISVLLADDKPSVDSIFLCCRRTADAHPPPSQHNITSSPNVIPVPDWARLQCKHILISADYFLFFPLNVSVCDKSSFPFASPRIRVRTLIQRS